MDNLYKEALERARKVYYSEAASPARKQMLAGIFPELAESKEEMIRQHLIEVVELYWGTTKEPGKAEDLAWLESKKEQKPADWTDADEKILKRIIEERLRFVIPVPGNGLVGVTLKHSEDTEAINWLKRRVTSRPQPKQEWSAEDEKMRKEIVDFIRWAVDRGSITNAQRERSDSWLAYLEKQKEKSEKPIIPGWSEEDEKMLNLIIAIFEVNHPNGFFKANELGTTDMRGVHTEEIISWLKSLRPQPRPKQEWDDGDVLMLKNIKACLRGQIDSTPDMAPWLTELPYRFSLLPQQMITEEVYFCVKTAIDYYMDRIHDEQIGPRLNEFVRQLQSIVYGPVRATSSVK